MASSQEWLLIFVGAVGVNLSGAVLYVRVLIILPAGFLLAKNRWDRSYGSVSLREWALRKD